MVKVYDLNNNSQNLHIFIYLFFLIRLKTSKALFSISIKNMNIKPYTFLVFVNNNWMLWFVLPLLNYLHFKILWIAYN
jgi:hypothetical protein